MTTKIHLLCDSQGFPLTFSLSAGQRADLLHLAGLLEKVRLPSRSGRPHKRSRYVVADKGYDSDVLRRYCTRLIIPRRRMRRRSRLGLPYQLDRPKYRQSNVVERLFDWLKEKRRLNTCSQ
ncbi:transposase [Kushneria indalinina]|uniref:transposase n=1 Tax=Kushneria indalinina TaxID=184067 RepID=UPI000E2543E1